jgi:hypothetical protein
MTASQPRRFQRIGPDRTLASGNLRNKKLWNTPSGLPGSVQLLMPADFTTPVLRFVGEELSP